MNLFEGAAGRKYSDRRTEAAFHSQQRHPAWIGGRGAAHRIALAQAARQNP